MELEQLDISKMEEKARALPPNWSNFMREIPAIEGVAYEVSSFRGGDHAYKCAVVADGDHWNGKCTCAGFPRSKVTYNGRNACRHLVAALLCQGISPELAPQDPAAPARPTTEPEPFIDMPIDGDPERKVATLVAARETSPALVRPVAELSEVRAVFEAFEACKTGLLKPTDMQKVYDGRFIKKSGWRKIAVFFGLSLEKRAEGWLDGAESPTWTVTYRAIASGGQFQDATGYCSWAESMGAGRVNSALATAEKKTVADTWTQEKADQYVSGQKAKLEHDIRATAETRAKNRAISDLVGGGEVSAEEMRSLEQGTR